MATVNKKKNLAAGVSKASKRVGPVDPNGAYTKVQERTLGSMKKGGSVSKAQDGYMKKLLRPKFNVAGPNTMRDKSGRLVNAVEPMMKKGGKAPKAFLGMLASGLAGNMMQKKLKKKIMKEGPQIASMIGTGGAGAAAGGLGGMLGGLGGAAKKGTKMDKAKGGKWIQKAVNPKHKGYCTPMTKKTCTPKRKALAMTFKKMAKARKGK